MSSLSGTSREQSGFSMVELLVTIVIAGIIFAAMVPFFANALSTTSRDAERNDAQNIAVDRIEQVRLLPYARDHAAQPQLLAEPRGQSVRRQPLRAGLHGRQRRSIQDRLRCRITPRCTEGHRACVADGIGTGLRLHDYHDTVVKNPAPKPGRRDRGADPDFPAYREPVDHLHLQELGGRRPQRREGGLLDARRG